MIDNMRYCANCEYWYPYNEDKVVGLYGSNKGECRRYPPSVPVIEVEDLEDEMPRIVDVYLSLIMGTPLMSNPFTFAEEWCGEFKLMDKPRWSE